MEVGNLSTRNSIPIQFITNWHSLFPSSLTPIRQELLLSYHSMMDN
ncbi:MAG: hypothetical protein ACRBFS_12180 [Aureispira sp.]